MAEGKRHRAIRSGRLTAPFAVASLTVALLLLTACSSSGGNSSTTPGPTGQATSAPVAEPEEALGIYVQRRLSQGFVADCDDAQRPDDVGKQCATRLGERNGLIAFALGPTFSEYTQILILQQLDGAWTIAAQEAHDPDGPDVPGIPWPLDVGAEVVVAGAAPDCLKVRQEPALTGQELDCISDGTSATIIAGPQHADEIEWWQLENLGWAASNYLRYPDSGIPEPTEDE